MGKTAQRKTDREIIAELKEDIQALQNERKEALRILESILPNNFRNSVVYGIKHLNTMYQHAAQDERTRLRGKLRDYMDEQVRLMQEDLLPFTKNSPAKPTDELKQQLTEIDNHE